MDNMTSVSEETPLNSNSYLQYRTAEVISENNTQNENNNAQNLVSSTWYGKRHELAIISFFGFFCLYTLRWNVSVALVAMVKVSDTNKESSKSNCTNWNNNSSMSYSGEYDWDANVQGILMASFFYGYIATQIPGGWLAEKFGGKKVLGLGIFVTAVLSLLTPVAAKKGYGAFMVIRVLQGLGEGVGFPAMHALWGKWAPSSEMSGLVGFTYSGAQMGTVAVLPISGSLASSLGWEWIFYVFGTLSIVWCIVWFFLVYDTPADHPTISQNETDAIERSRGTRENAALLEKQMNYFAENLREEKGKSRVENYESTTAKEAVSRRLWRGDDLVTPWKDILTSVPVWAICIGHFANNWGYYTLLTFLPTYIKQILKFDMPVNGFLSALPYAVCWFFMFLSGLIADYLRRRRLLSTRNTRKLMQSVGLISPAVLLSCISLAGCDHVLVIVMLVCAVGLSGFTMGGFYVNHIDVASNYSGTLMGISNTLATVTGILAPHVVGILTQRDGSPEEWQTVFYVSSGVYCTGTILYLAFASGEEQLWALSNRNARHFRTQFSNTS